MCFKKWEFTTLDNLGKIEGGTLSSKNGSQPFKSKNFLIPYIDGQTISNSILNILKVKNYFSLSSFNKYKLFPKNIVFFVRNGAVGSSAFSKIESILSRDVYAFNPYKEISDGKFIKYCFDFWEIKRKLISLSSTTTRNILSFQKLQLIKFPCPPHEIQQKIGDILSAYDELIENSEQQIEILERVRTLIYKKWFGEFYKKNAILPKEWRFEKLENLVTIKKGTKPASYAIKIEPAGGATSTNLSLLYLFSWNSKIQNIFFFRNFNNYLN